MIPFRFLPIALLLCLLLAGAVSAGAPAPADAHTIACAARHGKAKRACVKRASAHQKAHAARKAKRRPAKPTTPTTPAPMTTPAPPPVPAAAPVPAPLPVPAAPSVAIPAPASAPTPAPAPGAITGWRAAGAAPLSDAQAAALVSPAPETRPGGADENAYRPTAAELNTFRNGQRDKYNRTALMYNRLTARVTGGFLGTTDEILQWVAHKWGIPEDVVRSVAANESTWDVSQLGDLKRVIDPLSYPAYSRVGTTSNVYQSLGIMQIKWTPQGLHPGTDPLRWKSTAFNADYWGAVVRYYYDGLCDWCGAGYASGQGWNAVGAWYNPSPWGAGSQTYQANVKTRLAGRPWAQAGF